MFVIWKFPQQLSHFPFTGKNLEFAFLFRCSCEISSTYGRSYGPFRKVCIYILLPLVDQWYIEQLQVPESKVPLEWNFLTCFIPIIFVRLSSLLFMRTLPLCPQLWKSWLGTLLLACLCVHLFICPFIMLFYATCKFWIMHTSYRVLKFHIWIPYGKIADLFFFFFFCCFFFSSLAES